MTGRPADLFVLDRVENPHPRMLAEGWQLRRRATGGGTIVAVARWEGYLQAMCAATGCDEADILGWMDRHPIAPEAP